jgi:hypothetical protein
MPLVTWRNPLSRQPVALSVAVVLIGLVAVAVRSETTDQDPCMDAESRERVRGLVLESIDAGLRNQVIKVFDVWMKDPSDQPRRALVGMHEGISAYVRSRANALKWAPPLCSGKEGK